MKLLALDTSAEACSVALWQDGVGIERLVAGTRHSELILGMVQEVLAEGGLALRDIHAIAFGRGPGSFTSLRIGAGVVQGLAFGADLPVVPVSSLAVLAQGTAGEKVLAALDARMHQVYWGAFTRSIEGLMQPASEEVVIDPAHAPLPPGRDWTGAGSGWDVFHAVLTVRLGIICERWQPRLFPRAINVAALGAASFASGTALPPEQAIPVYLRDDVAVKAKQL